MVDVELLAQIYEEGSKRHREWMTMTPHQLGMLAVYDHGWGVGYERRVAEQVKEDEE